MAAARIKVLLVEDNLGDARLFQESLAEVPGAPFDVELADRLAGALARLGHPGIDVILLDLTLPDSQGLETVLKVREQANGVPIVVLSGLEDEALAVQAVREGAQDYLIKRKVDGASLSRAIRYAIERHRAQAKHPAQPRQRLGKVYAFMGAKGGVGTTTVALNVASVLAMQGKDVVAIELRSDYGTFALQLNQTPGSTLRTLLDLAPDRIGPREVGLRLSKTALGLRLLFGPQKVEEYKEIDAPQAEALIKSLSGIADYTIVDLPCHPSPWVQAVIQQAHFVGLVVEREPVCVHAAKVALDLLKSWGASGGQVGAVIVNRLPLVSAMKMTEIGALLGCGVVGIVPPAAEDCIRAQKAGAPLVVVDQKSAAAGPLVQLAERLAADRVTPIGT